jgi:hypothetical protein
VCTSLVYAVEVVGRRDGLTLHELTSPMTDHRPQRGLFCCASDGRDKGFRWSMWPQPAGGAMSARF